MWGKPVSVVQSVGLAVGPDSRLAVLTSRADGPVDIPCRQFEAELVSRGIRPCDNSGALSTFVGRALGKYDALWRLARMGRTTYLAMFMQPSGYRLFPQALWADVVPFCLDCWPPSYPRWERLFRRLGTRLAFFSARQSAEAMAARVPGLEAVWLPEAIDPDRFDPSRPLAARSIDVLEFGRRWMDYHQRIAVPLKEAGRVHLHETRKDVRIFARSEDFVAAMNDARIAICFPGVLTHPDYMAGVETMTQRYLEAMAAGCLIVGRCPAELAELFGYDPVIAADMSDPAGQIETILADLDRYEDLRARNLRRLREVGTWPARMDQLLGELAARGYR